MRWAVSPFWTQMTFGATSSGISASQALHGKTCFIFATVALRTQNALLCTSYIAVSSIWTNLRCFHSNAWTSKASIAQSAITLSFYLRICAIGAKHICRQAISRAVSSLGARITLKAPSFGICTTLALDWICFIFTTESSRTHTAINSISFTESSIFTQCRRF